MLSYQRVRFLTHGDETSAETKLEEQNLSMVDPLIGLRMFFGDVELLRSESHLAIFTRSHQALTSLIRDWSSSCLMERTLICSLTKPGEMGFSEPKT